MTLKQYKTYFTKELFMLYPQTEIDTFFFLLIEEYLGFAQVDLVLKSDFVIPKEKIDILNSCLKRLQKEEPIQYIIGKTEFYGLPFLVNKHTLIPRPETEELVEWILTENKDTRDKKQDISLLDIGTGAGCIPISLKKQLPNAMVTAIDVSKEALKVANENALLNNVEVHFFEMDILKVDNLNKMLKQVQHDKEVTSSQDCKFDVIVSNPPYVRELEKAEINNNVLQNEPHLALFVLDENPLIFYDKIANLAKNHLTENGMLFFEINQYLGKETVKMLDQKGFKNIQLKKDIFGNDRMVLATL